MTLPSYPETQDEAVAYAEAIAAMHGEQWVAIRLPQESTERHGMKFAAVRADELQGYLDDGATQIL